MLSDVDPSVVEAEISRQCCDDADDNKRCATVDWWTYIRACDADVAS